MNRPWWARTYPISRATEESPASPDSTPLTEDIKFMADYFGMKMVLYSLLLPKGVYSRESLNFDGT